MGVCGEKSHKVVGGGVFNGEQGGRGECWCVRVKRRWDGQGEEEMKVRRGDEELK